MRHGVALHEAYEYLARLSCPEERQLATAFEMGMCTVIHSVLNTSFTVINTIKDSSNDIAIRSHCAHENT
jgi:hypothetical protein